MSSITVTAKWLDAQLGKPRESRTEVTDRSGLGVRITPAGKVIFQMRYSWGGKQHKMDLGSYPATSIKVAKDEMLRWKAVLARGDDPLTVRRLEFGAKLGAVTNEQVIREWFDRYLSKRRKRVEPIVKRFERHVFPAIGDLPAEQTERRHWLKIFDGLVDDGLMGIADKLLADSKQALAFGQNRQTITNNPIYTLTLRDLGVLRSQGDRVLSTNELAVIWGRLHESQISRKNQLLILLLMLFGCRTVELRLARPEHFDFEAGIWTVPADLTKNLKRPIRRPLIQVAIDLLQEAMALSAGEFVFNTPTGGVMTEQAPTRLPPRLIRRFDMRPWSMHDLRRTARTNFSTLTQPHIAEKMLGHKLGGVWEVYDKHDYLDEQRQAYEAWLIRLTAFAAGGNVVPFERSA